jgi:hypothetical protein
LITKLQETHYSKTISDIKNDVKNKNRILKRSLNFSDKSAMIQQLEEIKNIQKFLTITNQHIKSIIDTIEKNKNIYITPVTLKSLSFIFGSICAIGFNKNDDLYIDFTSRSEKIIDILSFCKKIQSKIEILIKDGEIKIKEAQECIKNPLLRKQRLRQETRKNAYIKATIVASILILISPVAWLGWSRYSQEQLRWKAQVLMSSIGNEKQAKGINDLRLISEEIKKQLYHLKKFQIHSHLHIQAHNRILANFALNSIQLKKDYS